MEQQAPTFASQENCHFRSHSASGSTNYSPERKRTANRCDCRARSASETKKRPSGSSAPESHRNSQRLQNHAAPLSSSSWNPPSTSSAMNSRLSKSRKSSDDKTASGSKRFNFSNWQIAVLNGWLRENLEHPYPSEKEKLLLAQRAGLTLIQVINYFTNARRRSTYKKMCKEQGIIPVSKKKKAKSSTRSASKEGEKENKAPVRGRSDSALRSNSSRPTSAHSSRMPSACSHQMEKRSPEIEASQDHVFAVDAGNNPLPLQPCQVPAFIKSSGFPPAPPLPADVSPEVLAVSRQVADSVSLRRRMWEAYFSVVGLRSNGLRPTSAHSRGISSARSHQMEKRSPEIEASQDHVFAVDAGYNPLPLQPCQVPAFIKGSGFPPAPPLPADVSPEVLAVSRQAADSVSLRRLMWEAYLSAVMYHDVVAKGYKRNLPPEHYEAEELMAQTSSASKEGVHNSSIPSAHSPQMETSSPETEASQDHVFVVDAGYNPLQMYPCQVPVFIEGSGFYPVPPLPADVSPEVLAVSRQIASPVYIDVPPESSLIDVLLYVAEKHTDADVKAHEKNLPREHYIAQELMAQNHGATIHGRKPGYGH